MCLLLNQYLETFHDELSNFIYELFGFTTASEYHSVFGRRIMFFDFIAALLIDDRTKLRVVHFHNIYNRSFTILDNFTSDQLISLNLR